MIDVIQSCKLAKEANSSLLSLNSANKSTMLDIIAQAIVDESDFILRENEKDLSAYNDIADHLKDRLKLNLSRIEAMAEGLRQLKKLPDPVGEVLSEWQTETGLAISKVAVPFGVIAIIYEARPNVTVDAIGLCLKTSNSIVLRGSKDAYNSNAAIVSVIKKALFKEGFNPEFIQLIEDTTRDGAEKLMTARGYVDLLIPRGSAGLINTVVEKATVPVIETGTGNCHAYVEKTADFDKAIKIIMNGKTQRQSVCNALESMLVDAAIANDFLPIIVPMLKEANVEIYACEQACKIYPDLNTATDADYYKEYLGPAISIKVVEGYTEAVAHVNKYGSHHSEVIISENQEAIDYFTTYIDSSSVYVNASTRFTDGFEFGFGAEMGISTQKMHARGPMGLKELTSYKYVIKGNGQVRK